LIRACSGTVPRMKRTGSLLTLLASACAVDSTDLGADTAQATTAFVRTTTDDRGRPRFTVDGRTFRFIGGNLTELPWLGPDAQNHELRWARDVGFKVIRVWGVDDGTNADQMAARLRGVLDRASAHGLRVVIALTHNYHQPNWLNGSQTFHAVPGDARRNDFVSDANGFYTRDCGSQWGLWCLDDRWIDWGYTGYYRPYAIALVGKLADHPAVFAWDIANETSGSAREPWIVGRVTDLYVDMAARIKQADPNHMVTTGMISTSWAGMTDAQRDRIYNSSNVDYVTVHEYEDPFDTEHQNDDVWRARNRYGKPVVVEELGVRSTGSAQSYYDMRLRPADASMEATGIMYWGVASPERPETTDGVWSPQALGAYDWFVSFWQGWSATLRAEEGGGGGGTECVALASGGALGVNQAAGSCDGRYSLVMQGDGNLVLYPSGSAAIWASCTNTPRPHVAVMQGDGNLVVYDRDSRPLWNSGTWGHSGARVLFEGNRLVMRSPQNQVLWTSAQWCK
jgi:hypothetical protein